MINGLPTIVHSGDWHLGHQRTSTEDTVLGIRKFLLPKLKQTDILVLTGDIFNDKIDFDNPATSTILDILADVLVYCYEHEVVLRVVQGTYTHDREQLLVWRRLYQKLGIPVDFKIVRKLSIEKLDSLGISLLYVPDNLPYKTKEEVLTQIKRLLTSYGIDKVDYALVHGEFDHTEYARYLEYECFSYSDFEGIVRRWVLAGHVHRPHQHKIVIYSGSINRLAHDEEHPKGFWYIDSNNVPEFIENTEATLYRTVDYRKFTEVESLLEHHKSIVEAFPVDRLSYLRVNMVDPHLKQALRGYHEPYSQYIRMTWYSKKPSDKSTYLSEKLKMTKAEVLEPPSLENLPTLISRHLHEKHNVELTIVDIKEILYGSEYTDIR